MKTILEYLLSKTKTIGTLPVKDWTCEAVIEWLKSFGIERWEHMWAPDKHQIKYNYKLGNDDEDYWVGLLNNPGTPQCVFVKPRVHSYYQLKSSNFKRIHISFEDAIEKMEKMLNKPDEYI